MDFCMKLAKEESVVVLPGITIYVQKPSCFIFRTAEHSLWNEDLKRKEDALNFIKVFVMLQKYQNILVQSTKHT